jgi:hypothetical protein
MYDRNGGHWKRRRCRDGERGLVEERGIVQIEVSKARLEAGAPTSFDLARRGRAWLLVGIIRGSWKCAFPGHGVEPDRISAGGHCGRQRGGTSTRGAIK